LPHQKDIETCEDCKEVLKDSSEGIWFFDVFRKNLEVTQKRKVKYISSSTKF